MNFPDNIVSIHIELTDKCQAACPMCPRNLYGGVEDACVKNVEITLEQFKTWFPPHVLNQLYDFFVCGNIGEPLLAKDSLAIFKYIKETNNNCNIHVYTNGSLQTDKWWDEYISTMGPNDTCVFAIDGFSDTHSIYRRNTNWDRIIANAKRVIDAGKTAKAELLVFEHNEHQIDDLTKFLYDMGFNNVWARATDRFYGAQRSEVHNRQGQVEYYLYPAKDIKWNKTFNLDFDRMRDNKIEFQETLKQVNIDSKCWKGHSIYVNALGHIYPCCWVGSTMDASKNVLRIPNSEGEIRWDRFHDSAKELVEDIGKIYLTDTDFITSIKNSKWPTHLEKHFTTEPKLKCAKNCGTNFMQVLYDKYSIPK